MAQLDNVFVVEDQEEWVQFYRRNIPGSRQTHTARTLEEALSKVEEIAFAVAFVDIRLDEHDQSNVDGLRVMERIIELGDGTSLVVVTGHGTMGVTREALRTYRAFDVIDKTQVNPEQIAELVDQSIDSFIDVVSRIRVPLYHFFRGRLMAWDWEDQVLRALRPKGGAPTMQNFLENLFSRFMPAARRFEGYHVVVDHASGLAYGEYWSRGAGSPVLVIFGAEENVEPVISGGGGIQFLEGFQRESLLRDYRLANLRGLVYQVNGKTRSDFLA